MRMNNWYTAISMDEPVLVDRDSSPTVVYVRKNIEQSTWVDHDGVEHVEYHYDECKIPKDIYTAIVATHQPQIDGLRSDLEYISMIIDGGTEDGGEETL
jgi:hypothetical protein